MPLTADDKDFIIRALAAHAVLTSPRNLKDVHVAEDVIRRATADRPQCGEASATEQQDN